MAAGHGAAGHGAAGPHARGAWRQQGAEARARGAASAAGARESRQSGAHHVAEAEVKPRALLGCFEGRRAIRARKLHGCAATPSSGAASHARALAAPSPRRSRSTPPLLLPPADPFSLPSRASRGQWGPRECVAHRHTRFQQLAQRVDIPGDRSDRAHELGARGHGVMGLLQGQGDWAGVGSSDLCAPRLPAPSPGPSSAPNRR